MEARQPAPNDVVVSPAAASGRGYTLSLAPDGPSQLWYASYDQAVRRAFEWAAVSGVRVWRRNGRDGFDPIELANRRGAQLVRVRVFEQLVRRVRAEYTEMPGLRLSPEQGARLWGMDLEQCEEVLTVLVKHGFLAQRPDGKYGRSTEGLSTSPSSSLSSPSNAAASPRAPRRVG